MDRIKNNTHLFITEKPTHKVFAKDMSNHKIKKLKRQQELLL